MSLASCSYQCTWISDGSTITCSLLGSTGDLYQRYNDITSTSDITPVWNGLAVANRPFIRIVLMENDPDIDESTIASLINDGDTKWYVDGQLISFGSNGLSLSSGEAAAYGGCFRKLTAASGTQHKGAAPCGGLEITDNLVFPSGGHNIQIKVVVALTVGSKPVYVQGDTTIRMVKSVGTANFASIYCDSGDSFVLDEDTHKQCVCKVKCWQGSNELTPVYCKWFLMRNGQWGKYNTATGAFTAGDPQGTGDSLTVTRDMIDTFGDVKVECYSDSARSADKKVATDIQTIADASDSLVLSPCPDPADGVFYQTGGPTKITFSPKVTDKEGNVRQVSGYYFAVMDSAGNIQNTDSATKQMTFDLLKDIAQNINEGPIVNITAEG
ncbi:MAG: hypothetical protein K2F87_00130 [Muribaculaceae bacterium]|nr:hypothetical protein [Muribaculaceae bacterium]